MPKYVAGGRPLWLEPHSTVSVPALPSFFATGSADSVIGIWDADELICRQTLSPTESLIRDLSISHDGQLLVASTEDDVMELVCLFSARGGAP